MEERYRSLAPLNYTYDVRGRMSVVRRGPRETLLAYNAGGYLSGVRDAVGRQVTFATDALGRVTRQTMADGRVVDYGYDAKGNVTGLTPPGRGEHRFTYGAGDLPGTYVTPLGATTRYDYDEDAQLKTLTRPGGDAVAVTRDGAGRVGSMTTGAGATTYAYDAAGRLGSVTAPGGVGLAYAYDGDLVTGAELTGPVAGRVDRTYDADFRTAGVSVNGGTTVYAYDVDGLLTGVGAMALARDAANGQVTGTTLGVVTDERTYNEHGEPTGYLARSGGTAVLEAAYTRDGVGQMTAKTETIQGTTANYAYFYDVAGRLVRVEKNGWRWSNTLTTRTGTGRAGRWGDDPERDLRRGRQGGNLRGSGVRGTRRGGEWRTVTEGGKRRRTIMTRWGTCGGDAAERDDPGVRDRRSEPACGAEGERHTDARVSVRRATKDRGGAGRGEQRHGAVRVRNAAQRAGVAGEGRPNVPDPDGPFGEPSAGGERHERSDHPADGL
ncbi:MAG: RHS repeat protein [Elusimicrobia bacterium]|nr:RHS repeat protein [Elusimicrobiota bacterium]